MSFTDKFSTPVDQLHYWAGVKPDEVYLTQPMADQTFRYTWAQVMDEVSKVANYLQRYPVGTHIAIMSLNCAHWIMADLAIQMAGHVSIPIYPTASLANTEKILRHSEAKVVFLGKMLDPKTAQQLLRIAVADHPIDCIGLYQPYDDMPYWQQLVDDNPPIQTNHEFKENDLISIVYTSGTTGEPKGVMISFAAVNAAMDLIKSIIVINQQDRFISYLPLAHVAERMAVEMGALYHGSQVSFIRSLETFTEDVKTAAPTIFFGVPRIWSKIKLTIESKLGGSRLLNIWLKTPLLSIVLKRIILNKLGFHNVRYALCAAAAVNKEVLQWYEDLGLKLNEAYGMSETCGLSHMTFQSDSQAGSVGRVIDGCECRLSVSGEVMLRNPAMMSGYFKQPDLTAEVIDKQGWLHTGDLGEIDDEGFLYITGRVKDIFKTSKGKYISPIAIEQKFQTALGIEQIILMGDGFSQPFLVVSSSETSYAQDIEPLIEKCQHHLSKINPSLETQERLSHIFISSLSWSPENGMLTPTLKMKRDVIEKAYQNKAKILMASFNDQVLVINL